ncbi:MAG: glycosyltransferase family 4 protein [Chloroflexi bacterium]|nr:glycosyltransferase family 4 protein [Chloroflexota bacterium]
MRIAIDYTAAIQQHAGIGRYTRNLVGALAELDQSNQYVLFSAGRDPAPPPWPANFSRRELPINDRHLAILWQRLKLPLPAELFTGRIDLFHSPDFVLPPLVRAAKVLTIHDLSFVRLPECSSPALLRYLLDAVPPSIARADHLLADSHASKRDLAEVYNIDPQRITVIYAGFDPVFTAVPAADDAEVLTRHGLSTPYILSVGTLQPRKNYPTLIRAYSRLVAEQDIPHQLVIAGERGWLTEEIDRAIADSGITERIRVLGFTPDADLPALYRGAALFAFPSLYEGFGIPLLEAMGCGTPVVASNNSSLPEVAGDAAILVEPRDAEALAAAMWRVLSDDTLRSSLCERGFARTQVFSWQAAAEMLLSVYRRFS